MDIAPLSTQVFNYQLATEMDVHSLRFIISLNFSRSHRMVKHGMYSKYIVKISKPIKLIL